MSWRRWVFFDYLGEDGVNAATPSKEFGKGKLRTKLEARLDSKILHLEASRREQWDTELFAALDEREDECGGLFEIRMPFGNIQHRLLVCEGPGENKLTILYWALEVQDEFKPQTACREAKARQRRLFANPNSRRRHLEG